MNDFSVVHGCDVVLPSLDVDQNCLYDFHESQICGLIMTCGQLPGDWTSTADWQALIINDVEAKDAAKYLVGINGSLTSTREVRPAAKGRLKTVRRIYSLEFEVDNLSEAQYQFLRKLQCGETAYSFWLETTGGELFGGPKGISPLSSDADLPNEPGANDTEFGVIRIEFQANADPDRATWTSIDTSTPSTPAVYAYGPVFNGLEVYGVGTEAYGPTT